MDEVFEIPVFNSTIMFLTRTARKALEAFYKRAKANEIPGDANDFHGKGWINLEYARMLLADDYGLAAAVTTNVIQEYTNPLTGKINTYAGYAVDPKTPINWLNLDAEHYVFAFMPSDVKVPTVTVDYAPLIKKINSSKLANLRNLSKEVVRDRKPPATAVQKQLVAKVTPRPQVEKLVQIIEQREKLILADIRARSYALLDGSKNKSIFSGFTAGVTAILKWITGSGKPAALSDLDVEKSRKRAEEALTLARQFLSDLPKDMYLGILRPK